MRKYWITLMLVVAVIGFVIGRTYSVKNSNVDLSSLEQKVDNLKSFDSKTNNSRIYAKPKKIAYVDMEAISKFFMNQALLYNPLNEWNSQAQISNNPEHKKKQEELARLKKDFDTGKLNAHNYEEAVTKLTQEIQKLELDLTEEAQKKMLDHMKKIPQIIQAISQERDYDLILQKKDAILYSKDGLMDEITEEVLKELTKK